MNHHYQGPTYKSWAAALTRCRNPKRDDWPLYGGRGIRVCERWQGSGGFERFLADMGERPKGTTLDRVNSDGDYEPSNCKWSTPLEQVRNRKKGFFKGEKNNQAVLTLEQVQEIRGVWSAFKASLGGVRRRPGVVYPMIQELAEKYKVSFGCMHKLVYAKTWREE